MPLEPSTFRLPPISIFPFVFAVPPGSEARADSLEVDTVLWAPLEAFRRPGAATTTEISLGRERREFPCFRLGSEVVWGLTFRILTEFLAIVASPQPSS
jgi:hypothetical protein